MTKCKCCGVPIPRGEVLCRVCCGEIKHKRSEVVLPPSTGSNIKPSPSDRQANALADWMKVEADSVRNHNVGESDYSKHKIQPWDIWLEYKLNPFDADIIKRVLRHKKTDSREMDYEKIIHICQETKRLDDLFL